MEIAGVFAPEASGGRCVGGAFAQLDRIRKRGGGLFPVEEKYGTTDNDLIAVGQRTFEHRKAIHERTGEAAMVLDSALPGVEGEFAMSRRDQAIVENQVVREFTPNRQRSILQGKDRVA